MTQDQNFNGIIIVADFEAIKFGKQLEVFNFALFPVQSSYKVASYMLYIIYGCRQTA